MNGVEVPCKASINITVDNSKPKGGKKAAKKAASGSEDEEGDD